VIHHVALETRPADVQAEVAWWARLGFERVAPPPSLRDRAAWVQRGGQQVHLLLTDEPRTAGHLALVVDAWPPPVEHEERAQHWDAPRAYARTPGGHLVELTLAAPRGGP
jgi:catechol 2,3-dioxygenase-like lactoylglutathione lyase family enzyme